MVKKTAKIWVVFQKFQKLKYLWNYNQVSSRRLRFTEKWKRNENGKLKELNLFINRNGTMRVGGRLKWANIPYEWKQQIILSCKHRTSLLIARVYHNHVQLGPNYGFLKDGHL